MKTKYKKITKEDVLDLIVNNRLDIDFYEIMFSASLVAKMLETSIYQARKYLRELERENKIYYDKVQIGCDWDYEGGYCTCDNHLPIWGYRLVATKKERNDDFDLLSSKGAD
jgi:hypothetical protein